MTDRACPFCGGSLIHGRDVTEPWHCAGCGAYISGPHPVPALVTDEVRADVSAHGPAVFLSVDRSIALHKRLGIQQAWNVWEYPRRLAALDALEEVNAQQTTP